MKLSSITHTITIAAAMLLLTSCEVEFSPNAEWKEIPVVYCLLDQDDDTTWARVERCYLGEGSIYSYSGNTDSINYPVGSIEVQLIKLRDGEEQAVYTFQPTTINRQSGDFASSNQPMYYLAGHSHFDENCTYDIRVRRTSDGTVIAHNKQPISLIIKDPEEQVFTRPNYTYNSMLNRYTGTKFQFKEANNTCTLEWPSLKNARLYQPFIRFYYSVGGDTTHIDIRTPSVQARDRYDRYTLSYQALSFLSNIKAQLRDDPRPKKFVPYVDLYLTACGEDFSAYMSNIADAGNLDQSRELYSNIEGGRGVFAARRTKLYRGFPADSAITRTPLGLGYQLWELNVGFPGPPNK